MKHRNKYRISLIISLGIGIIAGYGLTYLASAPATAELRSPDSYRRTPETEKWSKGDGIHKYCSPITEEDRQKVNPRYTGFGYACDLSACGGPKLIFDANPFLPPNLMTKDPNSDSYFARCSKPIYQPLLQKPIKIVPINWQIGPPQQNAPKPIDIPPPTIYEQFNLPRRKLPTTPQPDLQKKPISPENPC